MHVTVNNNAQLEVVLSGLTLYLTPSAPGSAEAQGYYAPVNLETRKGLVLRKTTKAGGVPVASSLTITPHTGASMDIDLTDLKWGCNICANWPYQSISKAVKAGDYQLRAEVFIKGMKDTHRSNVVPFTKVVTSGAGGNFSSWVRDSGF